jgi:hypothetical protein
MSDWRAIRTLSRNEMLKRVARFKKLKGSDGGLPDSPVPECRRKLYAVIGFQPPMSDNAAATSPVGDDASAMPAIAIAEGFNLGYCKAKPGKGPLMHNHDTNETFIPDDRPLALRMERGRGDGVRRPCALRRHLLSARRSTALHERHVRRARERAPPDVRHRRRPAPGRVHARCDAPLRGLCRRAASERASASTTKAAASTSVIAATPLHSGAG